MSYTVNFKEVETTGLEASIVADVLAGLRANEARYFWNKYKLRSMWFTHQMRNLKSCPLSRKYQQSGTWFLLILHSTQPNLKQMVYSDLLFFMTMAWQLMSSIRLKKVANERSVSNCQTALKYPKNLKENSSLPTNAPNQQARFVALSLLSRVIIYRVENLGKPRFFLHT